ncbi:MAG: hypothetical protein KDB28_14025, partial [Tetrasphaera sp.]|nr:hypothetical protein [Tetrasphaera sp.]
MRSTANGEGTDDRRGRVALVPGRGRGRRLRLRAVITGNGDPQLAAEQRARVLIDRQLADAEWSVQGKKNLNLFAGDGVACREVVMKAGHGRAGYLLYVDKKVVGVIEAKPEGATLSGGCADEDSENGIFDLNCPSGECEPCTRRISTLRARGWLQMTCRKPAVQGRADDQDPIPLKPAHRTAGSRTTSRLG